MPEPIPTRPLRFAARLLALLILPACSGSLGQSDQGERGGGGGEGGTAGVRQQPPTGTADTAGPMPLRRLTRDQYNNTIRDLLGITTRPADALGSDDVGGSGFAEPGVVAPESARNYWNISDALATTATSDLAALTKCDGATVDEACAKSFIESFGKRAYRRPLTTDEQATYLALYKDVRATAGRDHRGAIRALVATMLQSPFFLYRWELGLASATPDAKTGLVKLNPYEVASRLSYFFWNSMPDDRLFEQARGGKLVTTGEIEAEARRMLKDDRARDTIEGFRRYWLHVDTLEKVEKDPSVYAGFDETVVKSLDQETRRYFEAVLMDGDAKLDTLLLGKFTYVDEKVAKIYGFADVKGSTFVKHDLGADRVGVFMLPGFLAVHAAATESHPVKRGVTMYHRLLCGDIAPPNMAVPPPVRKEGATTRAMYAEHGESACAKGCHALFDDLGFAFENFDAVGRYRATENDQKIDATGKIMFPSGAPNKSFNNGVEMMTALAGSDDVRRCVATQWMRYALGRAEGTGDTASYEEVYGSFKKSGFDMRELLVAIAKSSTFLKRKP